MLSIQNIRSAAAAESYFSKDNYYSAKGEFRAAYYGKGADRLGLTGETPTKERFAELLSGRLSEEARVKVSRGHRPGIDCTFSAPKSVSIGAFAIDSDRVNTDMQEAHSRAVDRALDYLERECAQARKSVDGAQIAVKTGNLIAVKFDHDSSRDLDAQLHTHCVIINATQAPDGKWQAISNEEIYRRKMVLGAVYRAELARELREKGYQLEEKKNGLYEIAGFKEEQLIEFSTRRQQIEEYMARNGMSSAKEAAAAALNTRKFKRLVDHGALVDAWKEKARELGIYQQTPLRGGPPPLPVDDAARNSVTFTLDKLSERHSVFTSKELLLTALHDGITKTTVEAIERRVESLVQEGALLRLPDGRYTTEAAVSREERTIALMAAGKEAVETVVDRNTVREAFGRFATEKGFALSEGQKASSELILTGQDRYIGVEGFAGTGKTTMLEFVKQEAERTGYTLRGYCPSSAAAKVLQQETGIPSTTLASHLIEQQRGENIPAPKEIWVIDEASMVSAQQAYNLFSAAEKKGARVVMLGDRKQLSSVEAGKPFAQLIDKGMAYTQITEIRRQTVDDRLAKKLVARGQSPEKVEQTRKEAEALKRSVYDAIEGKIEKALDRIVTREIPDRTARLERIVADYRALSPADRAETLIITSTNADKHSLNAKIRETLDAEGRLSGEAIAVGTLSGRNLEKAELLKCRNYNEGDVIRFSKGYKSLGVQAGQYAEVRAVDPATRTVTLQLEDGSHLNWQPYRAGAVELYEKEERHLRIGDLLRFTKNDKELDIRNGEKAEVVSIDHEMRRAVLKVGEERRTFDLDRLRHLEYSYAITVHSSQGMTCERALVNMDTGKAALLGQESFYVGISRAKYAASIYTDAKEKLPSLLKKTLAQESALEQKEKLDKYRTEKWVDAEKPKERGREL
ncbi:MAG TPA: MobF family relaxase [bacterium]|nr:MobF family relaxase [bacterium]